MSNLFRGFGVPQNTPPFQGFGVPIPQNTPLFRGFGQPQSSFPSMFGGVPLEDKVADSANNLLEGLKAMNTALGDGITHQVDSKMENLFGVLELVILESQKLKAKFTK